MRLYDIDATLVLLLEKRDSLLEAAQGEVTPEVEQCEKELNEYLAASVEKIESALVVVQNLETDAEVLKAEEKRLADRRKSLEANSERLRGLVGYVVDNSFGGKVKTAKFTASMSSSKPAIDVRLAPDADAVKCYQEFPECFKAPELSKSAVKDMVTQFGETGKPRWLVIEELPAKRSLRIR